MRLFLLILALSSCNGPTKDTVLESDSNGGDQDGDGYAFDQDCNDRDAMVHPGADELCDSVDNNCDGVIDEGATTKLVPRSGQRRVRRQRRHPHHGLRSAGRNGLQRR